MSKYNFNIDNIEDIGLSKSIAIQDSQYNAFTKKYKVIDLGLPSGTLWCTHNVGVNLDKLDTSKDWEGIRCMWGEVKYDDEDGNWQRYKYSKETCIELTKYCTKDLSFMWAGEGQPDNLSELQPEDDIATYMLGKEYSIPTKDDYKELIKNTKIKWIRGYNGIKDLSGIEFINKIDEDKRIFIPCTRNFQVLSGLYWTSSLEVDECDQAGTFIIIGASPYVSQMHRCAKAMVRAIFRNKSN